MGLLCSSRQPRTNRGASPAWELISRRRPVLFSYNLKHPLPRGGWRETTRRRHIYRPPLFHGKRALEGHLAILRPTVGDIQPIIRPISRVTLLPPRQSLSATEDTNTAARPLDPASVRPDSAWRRKGRAGRREPQECWPSGPCRRRPEQSAADLNDAGAGARARRSVLAEHPPHTPDRQGSANHDSQGASLLLQQ